MKYKIKNAVLKGDVIAPPSKSQTMRAIIFATMARGESSIKGYLKSPDTDAMVRTCRMLGATIKVNEKELIIHGVAGKPQLPDNVIESGNSGQVLRFAAALSAITTGYTVVTGDHSVRHSRPMKPLMDALSDLGAECISTRGDNRAPIIIKGPIKAGVATLDGRDSQPVTAILIASCFLNGITNIQVANPGEKPWIGLTLSWLDKFNINYKNHKYESYEVIGNNSIEGFNYQVPGDFSSIAFLVVAALVTNSQITIANIDFNEAQGDKAIISVLETMGAKFEITTHSITIKKNAKLKGQEIDVNDFIDALPILTLVGCHAEGSTKLYNAKIARNKESDRLSAITRELTKMGAQIDEFEDSLVIHKSKLTGCSTDSYNDHRIAMTLAVAGLIAEGETEVNNVQCVAKSYAKFCHDIKSLGANIEVV